MRDRIEHNMVITHCGDRHAIPGPYRWWLVGIVGPGPTLNDFHSSDVNHIGSLHRRRSKRSADEYQVVLSGIPGLKPMQVAVVVRPGIFHKLVEMVRFIDTPCHGTVKKHRTERHDEIAA